VCGQITLTRPNLESIASAYPEDQLMQWVAEAILDRFFGQLWETDSSFRPYAAAAFALRQLSQCRPGERLSFFRELATKSRTELLTRLSGIDVQTGTLRLLAKTEYESFDQGDWHALLISCSKQKLRRELHQLERVSPVLVRQLGATPELVRRIAILNVLNTLAVSREHWDQLEHSLSEAPESVRKSLVQHAKKVHSVGSFWDYFFECTQSAWKRFDLPASFFTSRLLQPLATTKAMKDEGLKMRNCMAQKVVEARTGRMAYFHWNGTVPASVQLTHRKGWTVGPIRAAGNKRAREEETQKIAKAAVEIIARTPDTGDRYHDHFEAAVDSVRGHARGMFDSGMTQQVTNLLRSIRGRSLALDNGSYCIAETESGYVQFMADMVGDEYLCEIQSHHFVPEMEMRLTDLVVSLVTGCGFQWPERKQNFLHWFRTPTDGDVEKLAEFARQLLSCSGPFWFEPSSFDPARAELR
jgi:hypothetical protein